MPGILYVVATPIGNLEDVTLRALRILRAVSVIAAEDTRRTARLLQHYSISTRTTSLHEHNERTRTPALIERLQAGESIALVSDAGTPIVSDPGSMLVAAAHASGIRVEPIPGPSAVVAAISAAGFPEIGFVFLGFPPSRSKDRKQWLAEVAKEPRTLVLYEAPHRIRDCLSDMLEVFGDRPTLLARELTKAHEELVVRPISYLVLEPVAERGEFTLVVQGCVEAGPKHLARPSVATIALEIGEMTNLGRREMVRALAARYGISSREAYGLIEEAKKYAK
jgi:16S rRNA (cytidine1402-2'-O)-methyltransferase